MQPLAQELNDLFQQDCPAVFGLLSDRGQRAFFPKAGILGQTAQAKGKKFNATIGIATEDDGSPMHFSFFDEYITSDAKDVYPYASSYGKPELRAKWQQMIRDKNPSLSSDISLPVVTNALTHALSMMAYLFLNEGEEIIVADKFWGNYKLMFSESYDVKIGTYNTFTDSGFDTESFRSKLHERTGKKVVLLNFPNNPSGYTPTESEVAEILAVLRERAEAGDTLLVALDDAYFGLVYEEGVYRESLFAPLAELHENILALKIDGATKEDYVWGFRIGFMTFAGKGLTPAALQALEDKAAGAVRGTISNVSHMSQTLLLKLYESPVYKAQKQEKYELLASRYRRVKEVLSNPKYAECFTPLPFNSGYFMCVQLAEGLEGEAVRTKLLEEFDTGVIATGNLIRIAYSSLSSQHIEPLFENLHVACVSLLPSQVSHVSTNSHVSV